MKKFILFITVALVATGAFAGSGRVTVSWKTPAITVSTNTADAVITGRRGILTSILGVYCQVSGTTQTNTFTGDLIPSGGTTEVNVIASDIIPTGAEYVTYGEGDVTADKDPIYLVSGDTLTLDGAGTASSNVLYKILVKETIQ